ncbi:low-specificity L-threonine aldolase [Bordetella sp. FB-8]|uniref:low-specificity L-threonine aldolase n=1 Tax=Bordetella sp. FB-8 TaxID=1159870 RepID=UPI000362F983|nr:low-specificity L-threonine aldolase [Bordetella sp. FB-8]
MIDLRSDTVTRPTQAMLQAMMQAPVGDDVLGDDPTIMRLQAVAAERAGKQAGLFFPSGTQSNLGALMAHCDRGDEYLVGQLAHTYKYEGGGAAVLGSIQPQPIEHAADGTLPLEKLKAAVKVKGNPHFANTKLLALENTFGGKVIPQDYVREATDWAHSIGLSTHLDGARVFNASVASGLSLKALCETFDSASICFSKGLGTPVGSVLVGSQALIDKAYRWRKVLGGGLRQGGILAAACLYALDHNVERLAQDHANAGRLAAGLQSLPGVRSVSHSTNMVMVDFEPSVCEGLFAQLKAQDILVLGAYGGPTRLVTHMDVSQADVDRVVSVAKAYLSRP